MSSLTDVSHQVGDKGIKLVLLVKPKPRYPALNLIDTLFK